MLSGSRPLLNATITMPTVATARIKPARVPAISVTVIKINAFVLYPNAADVSHPRKPKSKAVPTLVTTEAFTFSFVSLLNTFLTSIRPRCAAEPSLLPNAPLMLPLKPMIAGTITIKPGVFLNIVAILLNIPPVNISAMPRRISNGRLCLIRFLILIKHRMGLMNNIFFIHLSLSCNGIAFNS